MSDTQYSIICRWTCNLLCQREQKEGKWRNRTGDCANGSEILCRQAGRSKSDIVQVDYHSDIYGLKILGEKFCVQFYQWLVQKLMKSFLKFWNTNLLPCHTVLRELQYFKNCLSSWEKDVICLYDWLFLFIFWLKL